MKKLLIITSLILTFLFIEAGNVLAFPGHSSCQDFGLDNAQNSPFGATGEFTSSQATSGPRVIKGINQSAMEVLCVPK